MSPPCAHGEALPGRCERCSASTKHSPLRSQILEEAKAATRKVRKTPIRTWTKKPKYGQLQSTLDLKGGLSALRPSKEPKPDIQALSPTDFDTSRDPSTCDDKSVTSRFQTWDSQCLNVDMAERDSMADECTPIEGASDPMMLELDEILKQSREELNVPSDSNGMKAHGGNTPKQHLRQSVVKGLQGRRPSLIELQRYDPRYPGQLLQPDYSPISLEQLAAEVKSIYAGLTMVETKCIHVDRAQATAAQDAMTADTHWEALVALHRTLLHEHHDFFLATQHPSASPALRRLAVKYGMPGRMWRNGIRSVLDIFSSNPNMRPEQMQEFLRTVSQSMDMLQENIPGMGGEWTKIEAALTNFEMFLHDLRSDFYHDFSSSSSSTGGTPPYYGYLQSLYERTDPQHYPWTDQEVEFGDKYVIKPNTANNNRQDEVPWLPQRVTDTLGAWLYIGQAICWNNFNIFAKVFAVLSIAAQPSHFMPALF